MNKIAYSLFVLGLFGLVLAGCDGNGDDETDADRFVGSWNVESISDGEGDQTESFSEDVESFSATFRSDRTYELSVVFVPEDGRNPVLLSGDYTVDEANQTVQLGGVPQVNSITFNYDFADDDTVALSLGAALAPVINVLFGTSYTGTVTITISK